MCLHNASFQSALGKQLEMYHINTNISIKGLMHLWTVSEDGTRKLLKNHHKRWK